ncbi:MAG: hypothetical protein Aurels2KO_42250 [Aureliella sp.]
MLGIRKSQTKSTSQTDVGGSTLWISELFKSQSDDACKTLGMISGSKQNCDPNCITNIARQVSGCAAELGDNRSLVVHLDVFLSKETDRLLDQPAGIPPTTRSPLGNWRDVTIPMPVGFEASWSLLQIPSWLSSWRSQFGVILIDLGPCHLVPARSIGRLCGANVVLIGPSATASREWLASHLDHLRESGVSVAGSILASRASAA